MSVTVSGMDMDPVTANTLLAALDEGRIFTIDKVGNDEFEIREGCDRWYAVGLTKQQVLDLAEELRDFVNRDSAERLTAMLVEERAMRQAQLISPPPPFQVLPPQVVPTTQPAGAQPPIVTCVASNATLSMGIWKAGR